LVVDDFCFFLAAELDVGGDEDVRFLLILFATVLVAAVAVEDSAPMDVRGFLRRAGELLISFFVLVADAVAAGCSASFRLCSSSSSSSFKITISLS